MSRSKTVAISGAHGFIGSHLTRFLKTQGYEVIPIGPPACRLEDGQSIKDFFELVKPTFFIHLAGRANPGRDLNEFEAQYAANIQPALVLARNIPESTPLSLFFGSCEEYGNGPAPFRETQEPVCFSPYGWGKISAHIGAMMIARQRNLNLCWVRPFLTFGPGQETHQLIPSLIKGCLRDEEVPLTNGEQTRDFLYVQDLCTMVGKLLENPEKLKHQVLNLATGCPRNVKSVAQTIQKMIGRGKLRFGALPYRQEEAMSFYASIEKYKKLFGEPRFTPMDLALEATVQSYVHSGKYEENFTKNLSSC